MIIDALLANLCATAHQGFKNKSRFTWNKRSICGFVNFIRLNKVDRFSKNGMCKMVIFHKMCSEYDCVRFITHFMI